MTALRLIGKLRIAHGGYGESTYSARSGWFRSSDTSDGGVSYVHGLQTRAIVQKAAKRLVQAFEATESLFQFDADKVAAVLAAAIHRFAKQYRIRQIDLERGPNAYWKCHLQP